MTHLARPDRAARASASSVPRDAALVVSTFLFTVLLFTSASHFSAQTAPHPASNPAANPAPRSPARRKLHAYPEIPILTRPTAPDEANIAFFIQVSAATSAHLPRLLARLHHPSNVYAVHFDAKMPPAEVASVKSQIFAAHPHLERNVFFMPQELITYRGVSMALNTINAMKFLLERDATWHYFINLSGSDYPLVPPSVPRALLGRHVAHKFNFVAFSRKERWPENLRYRMSHFYVDEALSFKNGPSIVVMSSEQNPLARIMNFRYVNSEAWMINSREFCRFVVTDGYARKMLLAFAYSVESSEHYFSSLLWNHPQFNRTIVPSALRHVIWRHGQRRAGQHPFLVDEVQPDGSYTFKEVVGDSPNWFVRKFKNANSPLMDFIDARMHEAGHLKAVDRLYDWATGFAIRENGAKPPLHDAEL